LDPTHDRLLISSPFSDLSKLSETKTFKGEQFDAIKRFSPLLYTEVLDPNLNQKGLWTETKEIAIHLMPNIAESLVRDYLKLIVDYLSQFAENIDWDDLGTVFANLTGNEAKKLVDNANFIFQLNEVPKGTIDKLRRARSSKRANSVHVEGAVASASEPSNTLPLVCVMDTGVSSIPQLENYVIQRDGIFGFTDYEDGCGNGGHGTPVACLTALGKTLNDPRAKVISYKVYSDNRRTFVYQGFVQAINKYSAQNVRLFTSSIVFTTPQPYYAAQLNKLIQQRNICVTFSAGNIETDEVIRRITSGSPYPSYIRDYPVTDPSRAVNILSVGAITEKESPPISIAGKYKLSPFSRCGTASLDLYNCPKPEVVQHGGNQCHDGTSTGLGVDTFDSEGNNCSFIGTSFAAPLMMHEFAKIEGKYGSKIKNAETLKAIALAFSKINKDSHNKSDPISQCLGFGETKFTGNCDWFHTLLVSEGTVPLTDKISQAKKNRYFKSRIRKIWIPESVQKIEIFLVHSDDNFKTDRPSLNTHLKVYGKKTGSRSYAPLANKQEMKKKSHAKVFRYEYSKRSMEGRWRLFIAGEPTFEMRPEDMQKTTIRYGCAILITAKPNEPRLYPLTQDIYSKNKHLWQKGNS
jgi:hypothetical protein